MAGAKKTPSMTNRTEFAVTRRMQNRTRIHQAAHRNQLSANTEPCTRTSVTDSRRFQKRGAAPVLVQGCVLIAWLYEGLSTVSSDATGCVVPARSTAKVNRRL